MVSEKRRPSVPPARFPSARRVRPLSFWSNDQARGVTSSWAISAQHRGCMYAIEERGSCVFVFLPTATWADISNAMRQVDLF